jgi:endonuclease/exonuclease/phosphatase family metal-dependent hydrolase
MHLGLAGSERGLQLQRFLACDMIARLHKTTPVVIGGDLNDLWGSLGPRFLAPAGFVRAGKLVSTFPAALPVRPLDGIFVRGDLRSERCDRPDDPLTRMASDHLPLLAELELTSET